MLFNDGLLSLKTTISMRIDSTEARADSNLCILYIAIRRNAARRHETDRMAFTLPGKGSEGSTEHNEDTWCVIGRVIEYCFRHLPDLYKK